MGDDEIRARTPTESQHVFDMWWQLETWLREVLEFEAPILHGSAWRPKQRKKAEGWMDADSVNAYMASADSDSWLRYVSATHLGTLLDRSWDATEKWLLPKARWDAAFETAIQIRDRAMHSRRPHEDDATRMRLLLRDLDAGAVAFWRSFESSLNIYANRAPQHPLVEAWMGKQHPDAKRLVEHVDKTQHVTMHMELNQRPWAEVENLDGFTIPEPGAPGWLWVVRWNIGMGALRPAELWDSLGGWESDLTDRIVFLTQSSPASLSVAFSNVDDPDETADAIGHVFDEMLCDAPGHLGDRGYWEDTESWLEGADQLPARYKLDGPLVGQLPRGQRRYFACDGSAVI